MFELKQSYRARKQVKAETMSENETKLKSGIIFEVETMP